MTCRLSVRAGSQVVHADGDCEEVDGAELREGCAAYAKHRAGSRKPASMLLRQPRYSTGQGGVTASGLGLAGARSELERLVDLMAPGLSRADESWAQRDGGGGGSKDSCKSKDGKDKGGKDKGGKSKGGKSKGGKDKAAAKDESARGQWLQACKGAQSVCELATLLRELEERIYSLQVAEDVEEQRLWRQDHEWVGVLVRRFFPDPAAGDADGRARTWLPFDGKITGFVPAEGEDCALWHLQMDDGDDEELEEEEVRTAIEAFVGGQMAPAAGAPAPMEEEEAEKEEEEAAVKTTAKAGDNKRLWWTEQGRQRWLRVLRGDCSSAALSVAIHMLMVHCAAFDVLTPDAGKGAQWAKSKSHLRDELESYYHAQAFVEVRGRKGQRAVTARIARGAIR